MKDYLMNNKDKYDKSDLIDNLRIEFSKNLVEGELVILE